MKLRVLLTAASLLWGMSVATTALAEANVAITDTARRHFNAGVAYLEEPSGAKYEEAYREFQLAYGESPSYKILNNLGLCALSLERDGEAIEAYERFLAQATESDIPKDKRTLMERDIATLKTSLVRVALAVTPAELILTDERTTSTGSTIINRYEVKGGKITLGLHPGHHRITAKAEGYEPQSWVIDADSASSHEHAFELAATDSPAATPTEQSPAPVTTPPETHSKKHTPALVYVGLAATGVFAVGATVTGLMARSKMKDYDDANDGADPAKAESLKDKGETLGLITDIGIGAAVLSAGVTAVIYFTSGSSRAEAKTPNTAWQLAPTVGTHEAGLSFAGRF